jgi:hypothetical protein
MGQREFILDSSGLIEYFPCDGSKDFQSLGRKRMDEKTGLCRPSRRGMLATLGSMGFGICCGCRLPYLTKFKSYPGRRHSGVCLLPCAWC